MKVKEHGGVFAYLALSYFYLPDSYVSNRFHSHVHKNNTIRHDKSKYNNTADHHIPKLFWS